MSDANAKSSTKKTSLKKEVEKIQICMGPFKAVLNDKEYMLKMDPEYAKDYSVAMMELAIPVGTYTKTFDKNGKITKRTDNKTGIEYVLDKDSVIKATRKSKQKTADKSISEK